MKKTLFCPVCECDRLFSPEKRDETSTVRGEEFLLTLPLWVCEECGESIVDESFGDPVEASFNAYREKHKLRSPEQIQAIRTQWDLSQQAFATLLGMSPATINRYEQGSLPETTHHELILACDDRTYMAELLDRRGELLTAFQRKRLAERLRQPRTPDQWPTLVRLQMPLKAEVLRPSVLNGFRRFDFDRFAAVVVWLCEKSHFVTPTKLYKLLFYTDALHYRELAVSLTGSAYRRLPYGPVPDDFALLRSLLEREEFIAIQEEEFGNGNTGEVIHAGARAAAIKHDLVDTDCRVMEAVLSQVGKLTPTEISRRSHAEVAWRDTPAGKLISYALAAQVSLQPLNASGASVLQGFAGSASPAGRGSDSITDAREHNSKIAAALKAQAARDKRHAK